MAKPQRLRLSRRKGFNLQAASRALNGRDAVHVGRPGNWGNPFVVGEDGTRAKVVRLHKILLSGHLCLTSKAMPEDQQGYLHYVAHNLDWLRGKNLACWCSLDGPCHADTLLEVANK